MAKQSISSQPERLNGLYLAMDACAVKLDELNQRFPQLASSFSRQGVEHWRRKKIDIRLPMAKQSAPPAEDRMREIKVLALDLLDNNSLEDVPGILLSEHGITLTLQNLIQLIGEEAYLGVLKKDIRRLTDNAISYEQIAGLWNDLERPAPGGSKWNTRRISMLVG